MRLYVKIICLVNANFIFRDKNQRCKSYSDLFPEMFESPFSCGLFQKASIGSNEVEIRNIRDYTHDKHTLPMILRTAAAPVW